MKAIFIYKVLLPFTSMVVKTGAPFGLSNSSGVAGGFPTDFYTPLWCLGSAKSDDLSSVAY